MRNLLLVAGSLAASMLLSGCVAALVPLAAAGAMGKTQLIDEQIGGDFEAIESYFRTGNKGGAVNASQLGSAVLAPRIDPQRPSFTECGDRPRAVLIDIDGTPGSKLDPKLAAKRHERLASVARQSGAQLLYFSLHPETSAKPFEKALSKATGMDIRSGRNLFFDDGSLLRRDLRRWKIAESYCIVALVGDARNDFTDSFAFLELPGATSADASSLAALDAMIGKGWFLIPGLDPL